MSNTYSIPDFGPINKEVHDLLSDMANTKVQAFEQLVSGLEQNMNKPNWTMETQNQVEGTIGDTKISLQSMITFTFNGDELCQEPRLDTKELGELEQLAQEIGGESQGQALTQVVADSVEPQVVGQVIRSRAIAMYLENKDGKRVGLELAPKGHCLLRSVSEAVLIDYALMLSPLTSDGHLLFVFDDEVFSQQIYVAKSLLLDRKAFNQRYEWSDQTHGKQLSIRVDAQFMPHA